MIEFYKQAYQACDYVAAREKRSVAIIKNTLRKDCMLAFDSLPLTAQRYEKNLKPAIEGRYVCVSGVVNYKHDRSKIIANRLLKEYPGHKFIYLAGSKEEGIHHEEPIVYESLKKYIPELTMFGAESFEQWLSVIKYAALLVSGRYHYTIGAMCTGTPTVYFPSNTPKIDAIAEEYNLPKPVTSDNDLKFRIKIFFAIKNAKRRKWINLGEQLCQSASENYNWS